MLNQINKLSKIIFINLFVFLFILIFFETFFLGLRAVLGYKFIGWIFPKEIISGKDYCNTYTNSLFLGHIHKHENKCNIKGGYAIGEYVYYDDEIGEKNIILTLGGSTTDGWFSKYSDGETYPKILNQFLIDNNNTNWTVINGGVAGYTSSQEFMKLSTSALIMDKNIKIILSLNGINEYAGYRGTNKFINTNFPFFNRELSFMQGDKKFIHYQNILPFLPNINSALRFFIGSLDHQITNKTRLYDKRSYIDIYNGESKLKNITDRWEYNVKNMHAISKINGVEYYVFLQPTMGLEGPNNIPPLNTNDRKIYDGIGNTYFSLLNELYTNLRERCDKIYFCYDFSQIAQPKGNVYYNKRHHNDKGNKIIAEEIYKIIK